MASGRCFHHPSRDAMAQCAGCGKGICKDCYDMYGVNNGEYAGQALCYDCTTQLVSANVEEVGKLKKKTTFEMIFAGVGMVIGGILGGAVNPGEVGSVILFALIGGGGLRVIKAIGAALKGGMNLASGSYVGFIDMIKGIGTIIIAPIITIVMIIRRITQIKKANEIIADDSQALQEMRDYFAYTQVMEKQNASVDLAKLAAEGSELFDNTYARAVLEKGEKTAQDELRKSVVQIAANGEIIRSYNDPAVKKKDKAKAA